MADNWTYCGHCRRYYRRDSHSACDKAPTSEQRAAKKPKWWRPWMVKTAADLKIERKFAKCKSMEMFGRAA